ncbi:hypothetical protein KF367_000885 [Salmonella enterica subsp. enterica serovar Infantis]|nr:hypothetical protein [Salmonella enterica]EHJ8320888.1 hypothetical protein [Salmonella enterica subsp. enterica serovar Infantis]EHM9825804.1 hypothetical protein [Salmonella enterica subsp. enterica serovar Infantis]
MLENHPALNDHRLASYAAWISLTRPLHEEIFWSRNDLAAICCLTSTPYGPAAELVMEYRLAFEDMLKDSKDVF